MTRQQVYDWRHELKRKGLWSPAVSMLFLPIDVTLAAELPAVLMPDPAPVIRVELQLAKGRMLWFPSSMDDKVLTRLIRSVGRPFLDY